MLLSSSRFAVRNTDAGASPCAGILGENVPIPARLTTSPHAFWLSNGATFLISGLVFLALNLYLHWKRLLL